MAKLAGIALALLLALIIIVVPMSGVKAQETLIWQGLVYSNGDPVTTSVILEDGRLYYIVVAEIWWYDKPNNLAADAQYYTTIGSDGWDIHWNWADHLPAPDGHSFLQINGMDISWGPFSNGDTGHTYSIYYFGQGAAIVFQLVDWIDDDYDNNDCHLPVKIYESPPSPRTIGFWKTHPESWPVESITIGGVPYTIAEAISIILRNANSKDATYMLAAQLIAAILNVYNGADASAEILETIGQADAFLTIHVLGSNPQGQDRVDALTLKDLLDDFNNGY